MANDNLYFLHANGFPSESYSVMLNHLKQHFNVGYKTQLAHDPRFPVSTNWTHLVQEVIEDIQQKYKEPVILLGHSMGGVLSLLVSFQRPELVKQVVMLDPPVIDFWSGLMLKSAKWLKLDDRITPAGRTLGRREIFKDKAEAIDYFRHKSLFKNVDSRCLQDYVNAGTSASADGIRLRYSASTEVNIYRTIPLNLYRHKKLTRPTTMVLGDASQVVRGLQKRHMRKLGVSMAFIRGGHLFPLERPEATAKLIKELIETASQSNATHSAGDVHGA